MDARGGMATLNVYADESSQDDHRYMVLSGIAVDATEVHLVEAALRSVQQKHKTTGTMKWGKVSKAKLPVYLDFCDAYFALRNQDLTHFHSMTVDTARLDNSKFNSGDRQLGFSKMVYQLLCKFGREYGRNYLLHCFLDHRTTRQSLEELRAMVNNGLRKHWGIMGDCVRRLQFVQTEDEPLLQINDILLGALASRCNGHHMKAGAAQHKCELAAHILKRAGIADPLRDTPYHQRQFTTWMFRLRGRGSERP